jgi:hypothetical protein
MPSVLNRIRNEVGEDLKNAETNLKDSTNRGEFETARYLIIRSICERISNTGGSDEDLKQRVQNVNKNFLLQRIIKDLEIEGIE